MTNDIEASLNLAKHVSNAIAHLCCCSVEHVDRGAAYITLLIPIPITRETDRQ